MKKLPKVLILGRPNVGKSTLINRILGKKTSITHDTPGVTRDLAEYKTTWQKKSFLLIDSGGIFGEKAQDFYLQDKIEALVQKAMAAADKIVFLTEVTTGIMGTEKTILQMLRPFFDKTVLVVNKVDNIERKAALGEFYELGLGDPQPISSLHGNGVYELLDDITKNFHENESALAELEHDYKIAIIGRPNVGKSSLVNAIINEHKVIVDDKAGTTRDAIEVFFKTQGNRYVFVDTAGIRKKSKIKESIEFYSVTRSAKRIKEADLVLLLLEQEPFMCDQDKKIIRQVFEAKKNMIIFVNKWDQTSRTDQMRKDLITIARDEIPQLNYYPFIFGSAKEKLNLGKIFNTIPKIIKNAEVRISTSELNQFITDVIKPNPPAAKLGQKIKIYYATQVKSNPHTFVFFINNPKSIPKEYVRFMEKRIRMYFDKFEGTSINIYFKKKTDRF
jgi:GTP-binding protein